MKGESTTLITDKEKETLEKTSSHDNNNNIDNNDNQSHPGININPRPIEKNNTLLLKFHLLEKP